MNVDISRPTFQSLSQADLAYMRQLRHWLRRAFLLWVRRNLHEGRENG